MASLRPSNAIVALYPGSLAAVYGLLAIFLVCIFFLKGGVGNALAVCTFVASWALIGRENRAGTLSLPPLAPIAVVFLAVISARLALPPYGVETVPGSAIVRALLLVGLYGLAWYAYVRLPFQNILWMIAVAAFLGAAIAIALYLPAPPEDLRLNFVGRASHPIMGAGAVACGFIAAVTLLSYGDISGRSRIVLVLMCAVMVAGIYLTRSRGPMLSVALSLVLTPLVLRFASWKVLLAGAFIAWGVVTAGVLLDGPIKAALCSFTELACRASLRHDVWRSSLDLIAANPLWGSGYGFRFEGVPHAHNGYLGLALHYGLPVLFLFLGLLAVAFRTVGSLGNGCEKFFIVAMLIFVNGFMGSDLSDPMRFFSTHYLFLWLPLFFALMSVSAQRSAQQPVAVAA